MICRRFSSFRFRFSVFKVVLSDSSSFIEAISSNTKYLQNGHEKLYYACPFKAANIAFFQLWSPITSQCPFLRPPIRFNTLYCCNRPMLYLTPSSVMPSIASATSCRVAVGCSCRYFMISFWGRGLATKNRRCRSGGSGGCGLATKNRRCRRRETRASKFS